MISDKVLKRYISSSKICKVVLDEIILKIQKSQILLLKELHLYGNKRLQEELELHLKPSKDEKNYAIAFPTSISLNNCVGNYLYNDDQKINPGDIVKIQLGINLSGCIVNIGETIYYNEHNDNVNDNETNHQKYLNLLKDLQIKIKENMISGNTNDDVKILIESTCTESGCFPVENTISYQHLDGQEFTDESKYIITNYKKYYDDEDVLISKENLCFEFEKGEVYTINLTIIQNNSEKENNKLIPTNMGIKINEFMLKNFNNIIDISFSANLENFLDKIAIGKANWVNILQSFYDTFNNIRLT